jgi:hypothetical protein
MSYLSETEYNNYGTLLYLMPGACYGTVPAPQRWWTGATVRIKVYSLDWDVAARLRYGFGQVYLEDTIVKAGMGFRFIHGGR